MYTVQYVQVYALLRCIVQVYRHPTTCWGVYTPYGVEVYAQVYRVQVYVHRTVFRCTNTLSVQRGVCTALGYSGVYTAVRCSGVYVQL